MPGAPPLTSSNAANNIGNNGLRRVSGLLKALSNTSDDQNNLKHPFIPENVTQEKLLQKHRGTMAQLRISEAQMEAVIGDSEQFRKIQQALRDFHAQSDALAKQIAPALIRERLAELREQEALVQAEIQKEQRHHREEQRKLKIQRELTEARIKARQALNISLDSQKSGSEEGGDELGGDSTGCGRAVEGGGEPVSPLPKSRRPNNSDESPTSVANTLSMPEEQFLAFKPGLVEEINSEDGDIQEVEDEE